MDGAATVGFALLSAVGIVLLTSAVEAGWRAWRAAAKRRRRAGRPSALLSPAASAPNLPRLLTPQRSGTGAHAPRGLPEGEYFSPRKGLSGRDSLSSSAPPSPEHRPRAAPPELRHLPTIPSAADLSAVVGSSAPGSADDWAAAVARGEAWTKAEPWATLWKRSAQFAAEEAEAEAAARRAEKAAAEDARWAKVAARQTGAAHDEAGQSGWAGSLSFAPSGKAAQRTQAELEQALAAGHQAAQQEREAARALHREHVDRVRALTGAQR